MLYHIENIAFGYRKEAKNILENFSLTIAEHERWGIVGPSGCGKTTLLYLLAGLQAPQVGQILFRGQAVKAPMDAISFIQQDYGLFPWKTVYQNLALPLQLKGYSKASIQESVAYELERLRLQGFEKKFPHQLSGGQCQRVAIGRGLIAQPEMLLMDEPFSALDALTREALQGEVLKLSLDDDLSFVLVTHSIEEAVYLCNKLLIYTPQSTCPVVIDNEHIPQSRYHSAFVGQCAQIRALLEGAHHEE